MIFRRQLAEVIGQKTLHISDTQELARELAAYLLDEGLTTDLEPLLRDVMEYRAQHGIVEALAVSAHPINDEIVKEIKDILKQEYPNAKAFNVISKVDPLVIGGVKVSLANDQLDLTVRDKLDTFKRLTANIKE